MKRTYICPMVKRNSLSKLYIMAASIDANASGTTNNVGAKENNMWHWIEKDED